jgi:hypothetical protein
MATHHTLIAGSQTNVLELITPSFGLADH